VRETVSLVWHEGAAPNEVVATEQVRVGGDTSGEGSDEAVVF